MRKYSFFILLLLCCFACSDDNKLEKKRDALPHLNKSDSLAMVAIYQKIGPWAQGWDLKDITTWGGVEIALDTSANEYRIVKFNYFGTFHDYIPEEFRALKELRHLGLGSGHLKGSIPSWIGELTNLEYLYIAYNDVSGDIPPEIGLLTNLKQLTLGVNRLSGKLPEELGNLKSLEMLTIMDTRISGTIPKSLSKLKNIKQINLLKNQLSGEFPMEILKPSVVVDCSYNNITKLSYDSWKNSDIWMPDLQFNRLSGEIPDWVKQTASWKKFGFYVGNQQEEYGYTNFE